MGNFITDEDVFMGGEPWRQSMLAAGREADVLSLRQGKCEASHSTMGLKPWENGGLQMSLWYL